MFKSILSGGYANVLLSISSVSGFVTDKFILSGRRPLKTFTELSVVCRLVISVLQKQEVTILS